MKAYREGDFSILKGILGKKYDYIQSILSKFSVDLSQYYRSNIVHLIITAPSFDDAEIKALEATLTNIVRFDEAANEDEEYNEKLAAAFSKKIQGWVEAAFAGKATPWEEMKKTLMSSFGFLHVNWL